MSDALKSKAQVLEFPPQPVLNTEQAQFHDPAPEMSLCGPPLTLRGVFHPLGFSVEILTNDPLVLEAANDSWGHLRPRHISPTVQLRICITGSDSNECPPAPVTRGQIERPRNGDIAAFSPVEFLPQSLAARQALPAVRNPDKAGGTRQPRHR